MKIRTYWTWYRGEWIEVFSPKGHLNYYYLVDNVKAARLGVLRGILLEGSAVLLNKKPESDAKPSLVGTKISYKITARVTFNVTLKSTHKPDNACAHEMLTEHVWEHRDVPADIQWEAIPVSGVGPEFTHACGYCEEYAATEAEVTSGGLCRGCNQSRWEKYAK